MAISPIVVSKVEPKGFAGSSCRDASRFSEEALGKRAGEQLTSEFYAERPAQRLAQEGGRA